MQAYTRYFNVRAKWLREKRKEGVVPDSQGVDQTITTGAAWARLTPTDALADVVGDLYNQWKATEKACIAAIRAVDGQVKDYGGPNVDTVRAAHEAVQASLDVYDALQKHYISVGLAAFDWFNSAMVVRLLEVEKNYKAMLQGTPKGEKGAAGTDDEETVSEIDTPTKVVKNKKKKVPKNAFRADPNNRVGGPARPGTSNLSSLKIGDAKFKIAKKPTKAAKQAPPPIGPLLDAVPNVGFGWQRTWSKMLGQGAYGAALTWLDTDANGNIRDRVVLKVARNSEKGWNNRHLWYKATSAKDQALDGVHMEAAALRIAHARSLAWEDPENPIGESIIKCRGYRIDRATRTYRIYMEYCGHGDLDDLLATHMALASPAGFIQESAIWRMLEGLAEACVLLSGDSEPGFLAGKDVIHRDLKPMNIVLGAPQKHKWRGWPTPKMIDFGMAFIATEGTEGNPTTFQGAGTYGFLAPEQQIYNDELMEPPQKISAKTNIFAIGLTMMHLMELTRKPLWTFDYGDDEVWPPPDLGLTYSALDPELVYSEDLRETVKDCLANDAAERWEPQALLEHVQNRRDNDNASRQTRFMRTTSDLTHPFWKRLLFKPDPITVDPLYADRVDLDDVLQVTSEEEESEDDDDEMRDVEDDEGGAEVGGGETLEAFSFDDGNDAGMMDADRDAVMADGTAAAGAES